MFSTPSVPGSWLGLLRLQVQGSVVTLQPRRSPGDKAPSLVLDLKTGRVTQQQGGTRVPDTAPLVHGVVGVMVLGSGAVLALVTKARRVTSVPDAVFHVEEIQLITHEAVKSNTGDLKLAALLQEALDVKGHAAHLYFSPTSHLTLNCQAAAAAGVGLLPTSSSDRSQSAPGAAPLPGLPSIACLGARPGGQAGLQARRAVLQGSLWSKADMRFVLNAALMKPLLDARADAFALPLIVGYVGQVPEAVLQPPHTSPGADSGPSAAGGVVEGSWRTRITLVARLACARAGTLPWRSGVDTQGAVAHLVESELLISLAPPPPPPPAAPPAASTPSATSPPPVALASSDRTQGKARPPSAALPAPRCFSLVQLRSSPPLVWCAPPPCLLRAGLRLHSSEGVQQGALRAMLDSLAQAYQARLLLLLHLSGASAAEGGVAADLETTVRAVTSGQCTAAQLLQGSSWAAGQQGGQDRDPAAAAGPGLGPSPGPAVTSSGAGSQHTGTQPPPSPPLGQPAEPLPTAPGPSSSPSPSPAPSPAAPACRCQLISGDTLRALAGLATPGEGGAVGEVGTSPGPSPSSPTARPGMRQPSAGSRGCRGQGGAAAAGSAAWLLHRPPARRKLVQELERLLELRAGGCWSQVAGQPPQPQQQLLHLTSTSCVDTTNLIQADVGNAFVTAALTGVGLMSEGHSLRTHQPALAAALDTLWANHGAVLADQLAGSGCASAAVIRAGGREPQIWDRLQHWAALGTRWYGYNFAEARRQDGLDLVTGVFQVRPGVRAPPRRPVQYSVVQLAGVSLVWAVVQLAVFLSAMASGTVTHEDLALRVGLPLACAGGMALWVWLNRSAYVEKPVLAPELTDLVRTKCK